MKYLLLFICTLITLSACEPITSEVGQFQEEADAQRKRFAKAKVRLLTIANLNAAGDTLPQKQQLFFNQYGEQIAWELRDKKTGVLAHSESTYTSTHQLSSAKYYTNQDLIWESEYQYDTLDKVITAVKNYATYTIKQQWTYDKDGHIQLLLEEIRDKLSEDTLKQQTRTVYVYEAELCREQQREVLDSAGQVLEKTLDKYDYDGRGRKVRERSYLDETNLVAENQWEYNQQGQVKYFAAYIVNETGAKILSFQKKYKYDRNGLSLEVTTGNGDGKILEQEFYEYQYQEQ